MTYWKPIDAKRVHIIIIVKVLVYFLMMKHIIPKSRHHS